ncbi:hypothetical protein AB4Z22_00175 [Paenibacillus sp. TAF58]
MSLYEIKKDAVDLADVLPVWLETLTIPELEQGIVELPKSFRNDRLVRFMHKVMTEALSRKLTQSEKVMVAANE